MNSSLSTNFSNSAFNKIFNFSALKKFYSLLAFLTIFISLICVFTFKLNYSVDFTGGLIINIEKEKSLEDINLKIEKIIENFSINNKDLSNINFSLIDDFEYFIFKIKENDNFEITPSIKNQIINSLEKENLKIVKIDSIGKSISEKFIKNVIFCIFFALITVFIYILIAFNFKFATAGVLSLIVNIFFILLFICVTKMEVSLIIITAILTIIGYAINDTIVIFDRIRESINSRFHEIENNQILNIKTNQKSSSISHNESEIIIKESLRKVITRSILTSLATLIASIGIFFIPSTDIHNFTKIIVIGIFFGTICSLFFATSFILFKDSNLEAFIQKKPKNPIDFNT